MKPLKNQNFEGSHHLTYLLHIACSVFAFFGYSRPMKLATISFSYIQYDPFTADGIKNMLTPVGNESGVLAQLS